jgi:hypothetical protein
LGSKCGADEKRPEKKLFQHGRGPL